MGMTYQELTIMGRLRKVNKLGPFGMFQRLVHDWSVDRKRGPDDDAPAYEPSQTADKVKKFFHFYAINSEFCCPGRQNGTNCRLVVLTWVNRTQDDDAYTGSSLQ